MAPPSPYTTLPPSPPPVEKELQDATKWIIEEAHSRPGEYF
jgi:hypothetical protein